MAEVQTPVLDTPAVTPGTGGPKDVYKRQCHSIVPFTFYFRICSGCCERLEQDILQFSAKSAKK